MNDNNNNNNNDNNKIIDPYNLSNNVIKNNIIIQQQHNDMLKKYIFLIRNIIKLDNEMLKNILTMCDKDKIEILIAYNDVLDVFNILLSKLR
jgi:hypothetical protein